MTTREQTRTVRIGDRVIGGGNPILIQSMTNTRTEDVDATTQQILNLEKAGCDAPVYRGSADTYDGTDKTAFSVFGEDGMGDAHLIDPKKKSRG